MRYLIDTHVCLWALFEEQKLSTRIKAILLDSAPEIFVSRISLFEIAIKHQVGKLPDLKVNLSRVIQEILTNGMLLLPISDDHLAAYFNCSFFHPDHKDPFDRLLIATADFEKMAFITKDEKFDAYKNRLPIIW